MPDWSTAEWAQVIAAIGAAIAAIAASVAATVSLVQQRRSQKPNLSAGVLRDVTTGRLSASFLNNGPGVAVQVMYMLVSSGHERSGIVNKGHLGVGERAEIDVGILGARDDPSYMMWSCNDVDWNVYLWSIHWQKKRFSRRRWLRKWRRAKGRPTLEEMFRLMYPDIAIPE